MTAVLQSNSRFWHYNFRTEAHRLITLNKGWKQSLSQRSNTSFKLYPKLNHFFTEGTGEKSTPDEYAVSANIPSYVIDDIVKWVRETQE